MSSPRQLVLTFDGGGLCNRIFPFANAIASSLEHGFQVINPVFEKYVDYFRGTTGHHVESFADAETLRPRLSFSQWRARYRIARVCSTLAVRLGRELNPIDLDRLLAEESTVQRFWVDALYCLGHESFAKHADSLRDYFRPVTDVETNVEECLQSAREQGDLLIGVHIRQGDYRHHDNGMLFYETSEYATLMHQVADLFPQSRVKFLVCSNAPQRQEELHGLDWCVGPGTEIGDLYALAGCDYIVGPPSSYTQWASFYGEVPRLVHNRKYDEKAGIAPKPIDVDSFRVHRGGYGRFDSSFTKVLEV